MMNGETSERANSGIRNYQNSLMHATSGNRVTIATLAATAANLRRLRTQYNTYARTEYTHRVPSGCCLLYPVVCNGFACLQALIHYLMPRDVQDAGKAR